MSRTLNELKQGLLKCAKENEDRTYFTGRVIVSSICKSAKETVEELEQEIERLKQQVFYLEDNLRVARKDREELKDAVANGLEEFIKEKPHTSLRFLANKEVKEENERLRQQIKKLECCSNCKHSNTRCQLTDICDSCFNSNKWESVE